jgi:hypothetical protein
MFKRASQCTPTVSVLYFGPFNPFHYSHLQGEILESREKKHMSVTRASHEANSWHHTGSEQSENEIKKVIPFITVSNRIKLLAIKDNLNEHLMFMDQKI